MNGWLIYDKTGAERNAWFIRALISAFKEQGLGLELIVGDAARGLPSGKPDFALVRAIHPEWNRALEQMGIPVFNNAATAQAANDKWQTYCLCRELGIPVLPTAKGEDAEAFIAENGYPLIAKSRAGHGGSEVFWVSDLAEWKALLARIRPEEYLLQRVCSEPGTDMRVYALSHRIIGAMVRHSDTDFRSNFSLGGSASAGRVEKEQQEVVEQLRRALNFDFIGVDFIREQGSWMLNEIEDPVGTRMLYAQTDVDPAALYAAHIAHRLQA